MVQSKETALYQENKIGDDIQHAEDSAAAAAGTATTYITETSESGITVHPSNTTANRVEINGNGMEVFKNNTSVAKYGDTARIGKESSSHVDIGSNSINMVDPNGDIQFSVMSDSIASTVTRTMSWLLKERESTPLFQLTKSGSLVVTVTNQAGVDSSKSVADITSLNNPVTWNIPDGFGEGKYVVVTVSPFDNQLQIKITAPDYDNEPDESFLWDIKVAHTYYSYPTSASIDGYPLADFVIDQGSMMGVGSDGDDFEWHYRKWKSGTSECWGTGYTTSKTTVSDGGGYVSDDEYYPASFPPALFVDTPVMSVTIDSGGIIGALTSFERPDSAHAGAWKLYRVSRNTSTAQKRFMIYCIGRWK